MNFNGCFFNSNKPRLFLIKRVLLIGVLIKEISYLWLLISFSPCGEDVSSKKSSIFGVKVKTFLNKYGMYLLAAVGIVAILIFSRGMDLCSIIRLIVISIFWKDGLILFSIYSPSTVKEICRVFLLNNLKPTIFSRAEIC